jgi:hypothetical protein
MDHLAALAPSTSDLKALNLGKNKVKIYFLMA